VKRQPKAQAWYFIQDDERNFFHEVDARVASASSTAGGSFRTGS
jgi:hypothetical protein